MIGKNFVIFYDHYYHCITIEIFAIVFVCDCEHLQTNSLTAVIL